MTWWQEADSYCSDAAVSEGIYHGDPMLGPHGPAIVRVFQDGRTVPGWGSEFMENYTANKFHPKRVGIQDYEVPAKRPFALVMRSISAICIDIDGKNGGFEGVKQLGFLPPTLAETSKSGNGYHLFYYVPDEWDSEQGFARFSDRIGIADGVDIRAVGCVYHYPNQKWNDLSMTPLPGHLKELLLSVKKKRDATIAALVTVMQDNDPVEVAMMHDQLLEELAQPIASGKRNNTLFAIGSKMKAASVPQWDSLVYDRAIQLGLGAEETTKLVGNIEKYS